MSNLKILYIIPQLETGGTEKNLLDLALHFNNEYQVLIVVTGKFKKSSIIHSQLIENGINVIYVNYKNKSLLSYIRIIKIAIKFKPLIIHSFLYGVHFIDLLLKIFTSSYLITTRRNIQHWRKSKVSIIEKIVNRYTNLIICNSRAAKKIAIEQENIDSKKIIVIHNHISKYSSTLAHIEPEKINPYKEFACIATIKKLKNQIEIIRAISLLIERNPTITFRFRIIGRFDDLYIKEIINEIDNLQLSDLIQVFNESSDLDEHYRHLSFTISSSTTESFPTSIVESLQKGKPVIASNVGGCSEIIVSGVNGDLYELGNTLELSYLIEKYLTYNVYLEKLQFNSVLSVQSLQHDKIMSMYNDIYINMNK